MADHRANDQAGMSDLSESPTHQHRRPDESDISQVAGRVIVSTTAIGIVAVDDKGVIRSCNKAAEGLLSRARKDLIGLPLGYPADVNETRQIDVLLPNGDAKPLEMRVSRTTWEGRNLYVTALYDLSETDRAVVDMETLLEHQNTALAVTAHELEEPLVAIGLAAHHLRRRENATSDKTRTELLDRIDDQTHYMHALVTKLRMVTRIDAKQTHATTEPVHVFPMLLQRVHILNQTSAEVNLHCDPGIMVLANRTEFAQMVDNYLRNALTHGMPPLDLQARQQGDWVEIRIRDHGPGVPDDFTPHLFERFRRSADSPHYSAGTGLGLWITRGLARAHGGDAWYEPHQPHGACFCLRLPAYRGREEAPSSC